MLEVNAGIEADPELINTDPFYEGWFIKLKLDSAGMEDAKKLLDEAAYTNLKESADKH